jgi:methionine-rich copper-binding protein CopC
MKQVLFAAALAFTSLAGGPVVAQSEDHPMQDGAPTMVGMEHGAMDHSTMNHSGMQGEMGSMLASSSPEDGAVLDEAPRALNLTFQHAVILQTVSIIGPGDIPVRGNFRRPSAQVAVYNIALPAGLAAGDYVANWTASGMGHDMAGVVRFTVR